MHVAFNTEELTASDRKFLAALVGEGDWPATPTKDEPVTVEVEVQAKPAPAKKAAPAAPKSEPKPEPVAEPEPEATPEPEAEPDEDLVGDQGPTMADAVAAATKLVSSGGAPKVKEALATVGAKRVSEIPADSIAAFLAALA